MPEHMREVCVSQRVARRSVLMAGCSRPNKDRGFTTVALVTSGRGVDILQWIRESRRASGYEEGKYFIIDFREANGRPFAGSSGDKFY
jgi:hypothetical protein